MDDLWTRFVQNLADRVSGPMKFRMLMQPLMASIFAIRAGLSDAKAGKPPWLWGLITNPGQRAEMLRSGWQNVGMVFVLAIVLDVIYQFIELHTVHPGEAIFVGFLLAIVPYSLVRGLVTRLAPKQ